MEDEFINILNNLYYNHIKESEFIIENIKISIRHWTKQKEIELQYEPSTLFKKKHLEWEKEMEYINNRIAHFEQELEEEQEDLERFKADLI